MPEQHHQTLRASAVVADNLVTLTSAGGDWFVRRTFPDGRTDNMTQGASTYTYARLVFVETVDRLTKGL